MNEITMTLTPAEADVLAQALANYQTDQRLAAGIYADSADPDIQKAHRRCREREAGADALWDRLRVARNRSLTPL